MLGDRSGTTQCQPRRQPQAHRGSLLAAETEARVSRRQRHVSPVNQKKKKRMARQVRVSPEVDADAGAWTRL